VTISTPGKHSIVQISGAYGILALSSRALPFSSLVSLSSAQHLTKVLVSFLLIDMLGMVGLAKGSDDIIGVAFDILALEALFLVPRFVRVFSAMETLINLTVPSQDLLPIELESLLWHFSEPEAHR
jgi:hypothetical protein